MSTVLEVKASDIRKCFQELSMLIPKGAKELPVGISLQAGNLHVISTTGCVYIHSIDVDDTLSMEYVTILFHNVAALLSNEKDNVTLDFSPIGLTITGETFEVDFKKGYSVVEEPTFNDISFKGMQDSGWDNNLNKLIGMNLEKVYSAIRPITFYSDVAVQKYPNTWVQVRTLGIKDSMLLDTDHVRLLTHFNPTMYAKVGKDSMLFCRGNSFLQLPIKEVTSSNLVLDMMKDLGDPVTITLGHYLEQLRNVAKVSSRAQCKVTITEKGISTTVTEDGASISTHTGDIHAKVLKVFNIPIAVWITFLKALGTDSIQILVGGEKLCLRNHSMIILTRVLI